MQRGSIIPDNGIIKYWESDLSLINRKWKINLFCGSQLYEGVEGFCAGHIRAFDRGFSCVPTLTYSKV